MKATSRTLSALAAAAALAFGGVALAQGTGAGTSANAGGGADTHAGMTGSQDHGKATKVAKNDKKKHVRKAKKDHN
jgi:hypothetical protein